MFNNLDHTNELFDFLYDDLCTAHMDRPMDAGSNDHKKKMWAKLQDAKAFSTKGVSVRMGRWYDLFTQEAALEREHWQTLKLVHLYIALREGWWSNLYTSPLVRTCSANGPEEELTIPDPVPFSGELSDASRKVSRAGAVKDSNRELSKLRKQCKNAKEVALRILASFWRERLWAGVRMLVEPLRVSFLQAVADSHTDQGTLKLHISWAAGSVVNVLYSVLALLKGGPGFEYIDLGRAANAQRVQKQ